MKRRRILQATLAPLVLALNLLPLGGVSYATTPDCSAGKAQNIVAHPDDDLFFINPAVLQDIHAGKCEETIYMTSGDAGRDQSYWGSREQGLKVAYASMAGVANSWTETTNTILGHNVTIETLDQNPGITLVFMRLPNGGEHTEYDGGPIVEGYASTNYETMKKLWENSISLIHPVDGSPAYTRQEVIDTLAVRMATYAAPTIRTLDYTKGFDSTDHTDHQAAAYFARTAHQQGVQAPHTLTGYEGYPVTSQPVNVSDPDLTDKRNAYFLYDAYDSNTCTSVTQCAASEYPYRLDWLDRSYTVGSESGSATPWDWETVEGDAGSLSGYNADIGKQPASIVFNNTLYTFYYDASAGDLRMAKKASDGTWSFTTLDGAGGADGRISADLGQTPTVTIYNGGLQLFYFDQTHGDLRHARSTDGANWLFETLDGSTGTYGNLNDNLGQTPKALVYGTTLQVFYYDATLGNLRHAYSNETGWHFENLDGDIGSIANFNADVGQNVSAVVYGTTLQLFYYDATNGNLRHAYSNETGWHFENLDGNVGSILGFDTNTGQHPTAVVNGDVLNVFYYDATNGDLRHAWTSSTQGWLGENLMGDDHAIIRTNANVGIHSGAVMNNGVLHVFAYEQSNNGKLVHLWQDANGWHEEPMDGFGTTPAGGLDSNSGMDPNPVIYGNKVHLFYYDASGGNLRHMVQ